MQPPKKISCIIPFFNEGERVLSVLETVTGNTGISQIICIDDGSCDEVAERIAEKWPGIAVARLQRNEGKSSAIRHGLLLADHDLILLMDADLQDIDPLEISNAIQAIQNPDIDMIILRRVNAPWFFKIDRRDVLFSGERIMKREDLQKILNRKVYRYQLEIAINQYMLKHKKQVRWMAWSASNTHKVKKWGLTYGLKKEMRMFAEMLGYSGSWQYIKQIACFARKGLEQPGRTFVHSRVRRGKHFH